MNMTACRNELHCLQKEANKRAINETNRFLGLIRTYLKIGDIGMRKQKKRLSMTLQMASVT